MNKEASFTFTTPLNVNVVEIKGVEHCFVEGNISTNDIDLVNDIMTKNCQESMQRQILEKNLKLDLEHEAFRGEGHEEKEINKTKIPIGKLIDATVKDLGNDRYATSVKGEINRNNPRYEETKNNLMERYLDAFSVAFIPTDVSYGMKDGKEVRMLNDCHLLNVALTGNPCNTKAQLENIFMKSIDAVEEYKRMKKDDPEIEKQLVVKSHSTDTKSEDTQLNSKQLNMENTDMKDVKVDEKSTESNEAEQKDVLKSVQAEMKAISEKYDVLVKEKDELKDAISSIAKSVEKITEALNKPVHKAISVQKDDEQVKNADAEMKSVDPLSVF